MKEIEEINLKTKVYDELKTVIDPELMINIVDLGLVYDVEGNTDTKIIIINHTLTSVGCPMGDMIIQNIEETVKRSFPLYTILVQLVWYPQWSFDMVSEEGRFALTVE